jgi:hypothetical protein
MRAGQGKDSQPYAVGGESDEADALRVSWG